MASTRKILSDTAKHLELQFLSKRCVAYGHYQKYLFLLKGNSILDREQYAVISFCVKCHHPTVQLQQFLPKGCRMQKNAFRYNIYMPIKGGHKHNVDHITAFLNQVTTILEMNGYHNCDEQGNEGMTEIYSIKGEYAFLTSVSADSIRFSLREREMENASKKENYILGLAGACIGAVLSSAAVFLVARLGYISTLVSALMGVALVFGYKWKGIRLSGISSVICILISLIFSYLVFRLDMAVSIYSAADIGFVDAFVHTREILQLADAMDTYYHDLLLMTGTCVVGTIVAAVYEISAQNKQFTIRRLG